MSAKDYSISFVRALAMAMIVACHLLQYYELELAWWLNVGVQIFLCISGYLYGTREVHNDFVFIKKRFTRILLDYYVVVVPALLLYCLFAADLVSPGKVVSVLLTSDTLYGAGHLWFVPVILVCYLITPLLISFAAVGSKRGAGVDIIKMLTSMIVIFLVCRYFIPYFNSAHVNCFVIGFFLRRIQASDKRWAMGCCVAIIGIAICLNVVQVASVYYSYSPFEPLYTSKWFSIFKSYAHTFLGVSLFVILRAAAKRAKTSAGMRKFLDCSDEYSYDVYLVHQFFIFSPFALMALTPSLFLNIAAVLLATGLAAWIVRAICRQLQTWWKKTSGGKGLEAGNGSDVRA